MLKLLFNCESYDGQWKVGRPPLRDDMRSVVDMIKSSSEKADAI